MYYWWWLTFPFISRHTSFHTLPQCLQTIVSVKLCDFWHEFYQLQEGRECCTFSLSQVRSFIYFYFILLSLSKLIGKMYPLHLTFCSLSNTFVDSLFLIFFFLTCTLFLFNEGGERRGKRLPSIFLLELMVGKLWISHTSVMRRVQGSCRFHVMIIKLWMMAVKYHSAITWFAGAHFLQCSVGNKLCSKENNSLPFGSFHSIEKDVT